MMSLCYEPSEELGCGDSGFTSNAEYMFGVGGAEGPVGLELDA